MSLSLRLNDPSHSDGGTAGTISATLIDENLRPRRASSWPITHSPDCSTLTLLNDTPTVRTSRPSTHTAYSNETAENIVMRITLSPAKTPQAKIGVDR
jgi:hypothetical protein